MKFIYPRSEQFPFDEACREVVKQLELRNWRVPGITVSFHEYGSGEERYRMVDTVTGEDFSLRFGRPQGRDGGYYNNLAAVSTLVIPQERLDVYDDESGPTYWHYDGGAYETDRRVFVTAYSLYAGPDKSVVPCIEYSGGCNCGAVGGVAFSAEELLMGLIQGDADALAGCMHTHRGRRSPLLVPKSKARAARILRTHAVMERFREYLEAVVLRAIWLAPVPTDVVDPFPVPERKPFDFPLPIFTVCDERDAKKIKTGKTNPQLLQPSERFGLPGNGRRLVPYDYRIDSSISPLAYEGFSWCGVGAVDVSTPWEELRIPERGIGFGDVPYLVRVTPSCANDLYVVDHAAFEKRRAELGAALGERDRFTDEEVGEMYCARARTLVPLAEYRGGYEEPVVLVRRELSFDEVEVVGSIARSR